MDEYKSILMEKSKYPCLSKIHCKICGEFVTDENGWIYFPIFVWWGDNKYQIINVSKEEITDFVVIIDEPVIRGSIARINGTGVSNRRADINTIQTIWVQTEYVHPYEIIDDKIGSIYLNNQEMIWSDDNNRWELNVIQINIQASIIRRPDSDRYNYYQIGHSPVGDGFS